MVSTRGERREGQGFNRPLWRMSECASPLWTGQPMHSIAGTLLDYAYPKEPLSSSGRKTRTGRRRSESATQRAGRSWCRRWHCQKGELVQRHWGQKKPRHRLPGCFLHPSGDILSPLRSAYGVSPGRCEKGIWCRPTSSSTACQLVGSR